MSQARPRRLVLKGLLGSAASAALAHGANACSRVFWNDNPVQLIGRTFDWEHNFDEALWALPAGMTRVGGIGDNPAHWQSRFGSVVTTCYDRAAVEGMNERGLCAHMLFLDGTQWEVRNPARPGIAFYQWAQYYLDNFASVQEAMGALDRVQVVLTAFGDAYPKGVPLHVSLADRSGDSAVVEFIEGRPVVHFGHRYQVMTNDPSYDLQIANLARYKGFGGTIETLPGGVIPDERFVRAAYSLKNLPKTSDRAAAVASMMSLLNNVSVPFGSPYVGVSATYPTWYRTIMDPDALTYYVQTTTTPSVFWIEMSKVNLAAGARNLRIGFYDPSLAGDATGRFAPGTPG